MRLPADGGEGAAHQNLAIRLDGNRPDVRVIVVEGGCKGGVHCAIGQQPGDALVRLAVDVGEGAAYQHFAGELERQRFDAVIGWGGEMGRALVRRRLRTADGVVGRGCTSGRRGCQAMARGAAP